MGRAVGPYDFGWTTTGALPQAGMATGLWPSICRGFEIPLPPLPGLERQRRSVIPALANGQGAEAAQMEAVRALIPRFEAKIQRALDRLWGCVG